VALVCERSLEILSESARTKTHSKIFPGDDEFARPFPPYLVSGDLSLEAEKMAAPRYV